MFQNVKISFIFRCSSGDLQWYGHIELKGRGGIYTKFVEESAHFEIREDNWRTIDSDLNRMKIDSSKGKAREAPSMQNKLLITYCF